MVFVVMIALLENGQSDFSAIKIDIYIRHDITALGLDSSDSMGSLRGIAVIA